MTGTTSAPRHVADCRHARVRHEHGTRMAYVLDGCRCLLCSTANSRYEAHRQRQIAYGRWTPYVDAGPARAHVGALAAAGMGWKTVARAAGLSNGLMTKLIYGTATSAPSKRIRQSTADAILAVRPDLAAAAVVPAYPAVRRLRALVAAGWPQAQLAARLGMNPTNLGSLLRRDAILQRTADAVRSLYSELSTADPHAAGVTAQAAARARNLAKARGWPVPALWDDDALDAADGRPWTDGAPSGRRGRGEVVEDVEWMLRAGETVAGAAARLNMRPDALEAALRRAGRSDLWRALRLNAAPAAEGA